VQVYFTDLNHYVKILHIFESSFQNDYDLLNGVVPLQVLTPFYFFIRPDHHHHHRNRIQTLESIPNRP